MRKILVLLVAVFAFSSMVLAQKHATDTDVFIGYSYMRSNLDNFSLDNGNLNGFSLQATHYINRNVGITADFTRVGAQDVANSGVDATRYTYLFGPTLAAPSKSPVTPFMHVLFGVDHERISISNFGDATDNSFAAAFGGGFDLKINKNVAFRPAQLDYIHTSHGDGENHFRYSAGIVLKF